jgi:signal peptide peptidase SppA
MKYPHVFQAVYGRPWLIDPDSHEWHAILSVLALRTSGSRLDLDEIAARLESAARGGQGDRRAEIMLAASQDRAVSSSGGSGRETVIRTIPIMGVISRRANLMSDTSGGASIEDAQQAFRDALDDASVDAIVFAIDSPGGSVDGVEEFAAEIRAARGTKPIVAVADAQAASAAYYIAAAAQEVVVTPSGRVGSIGVVMAHEDVSEADKMDGRKITYITEGKYKVEGNSHEPLGEEARGYFQSHAAEYYRMFVRAVAKGRGVSMETVRNSYGEGRQLLAQAALDAGMVDRIDTLDNTYRRIARGAIKPVGKPDATGTNAAASEDVTVVASAAADVFDDLEPVSAETEELEQAEHTVAMAQKHAAARATEGRPLSAADRERLSTLRGSIDSLLKAPAAEAIESKPGDKLALALAVVEVEAALAGNPITSKE